MLEMWIFFQKWVQRINKPNRIVGGLRKFYGGFAVSEHIKRADSPFFHYLLYLLMNGKITLLISLVSICFACYLKPKMF
jgi:hypothetical protein